MKAVMTQDLREALEVYGTSQQAWGPEIINYLHKNHIVEAEDYDY
jgi:hypothetical protein